uniref:Uncharacterized protein n=1 Tax=Arundo donax TaxID=35708 RepID=A0A0A9C611_ARUDO
MTRRVHLFSRFASPSQMFFLEQQSSLPCPNFQHSVRAVKDFLQWRMASRTAVSALPWHQYSPALDVDRRAGVAARVLDRGVNTRTGSRSARAFRHSGTRKRRYLSSSRLVASSAALGLAPGRREKLITEAGVLCAVWNAGDEATDASA